MDYEKYKSWFKTQGLKYLPDFLFPKFKPKILDYIKKDKENLGRIIGINLKPINFLDESQLSMFIEGILKLKSCDDTMFYIEGMEHIPKFILIEIGKRTGLNFKFGDNTRIFNIPQIIIKAYDILEEDYNSKETLVICKDKERLLELMQMLSDHFKFLSVFGLDEVGKNELYEAILEATGISIFQPVQIDRLIKNYNIIINFNDEIDFNISNIRSDALIIDFSEKKPFNLVDKKGIIIEDINFELNIENEFIEKFVSPPFLESLCEDWDKVFTRIKVKDSFYSIEEIIGLKVKLKGKF
ncbi:hypothetical protein [Paratissierella segnis]|uniref:hypothetical protein n=1 Tax=Paratissierella segnis TaxID=2763679 RepID=UPI00223C3A76|nr:hypothetical protein [Paratissierella segnis]